MQLTSHFTIRNSWVFTNLFVQNTFHSPKFCLFFSVLLLKQSKDASSALEIIYPLVLLFWPFAVVFIFCEFGEKVSTQFQYFNDELCKCDWYLLPIEMQRILLTVMTNSQQPIFIQGYGNTLCIRYSFNKVNS